MRRLAVLLLAMAGWVVVATAEDVTGTNTVITARQLTFDYGRMIAVLDGDVMVVDPEIRMRSDKMTVMFEGSNEVKSVTAVGNVRLQQAEKRGQADMAVYVAKLGEIVLTGNAMLAREQDTVMGDTITFWLNEQRMICKPGRLVLHPREGGTPGPGAAFGVLPDTKKRAPRQAP
jgi:lipopolysaccharide transport protein LptA